MSSDCLFCKIINKEAPAEIVYEDDEIVSFRDINPAAPVHLLVVPRKHIPTHVEIEDDDMRLLGKIHLIINDLARAFRLDSFRVTTNCGADAGQAVFHLHFHLLGGGSLKDIKA